MITWKLSISFYERTHTGLRVIHTYGREWLQNARFVNRARNPVFHSNLAPTTCSQILKSKSGEGYMDHHKWQISHAPLSHMAKNCLNALSLREFRRATETGSNRVYTISLGHTMKNHESEIDRKFIKNT